MNDRSSKEDRSWTEEIEFAGSELVERIKELIQEGNVRRLIIRTPGNKMILEVPLSAGVAVGAALALFAPVLTALGAVAAFFIRVRVEVTHADGEKEE